MSQRFQGWLLRNTTTLQYLVNERLAKRNGAIGNLFKKLEIGERNYSPHAFGRAMKLCNYWFMATLQLFANLRGVGSRMFTGTTNGPLNFSGLMMYLFGTILCFSRLGWERPKDSFYMN